MENDLLDSITISFIAQMDAAMEIANKVSQHSNEEILSPDSLISGLVYRLMVPMSDEEMKTSIDSAKNFINDEDSEDEGEYDFGKDLFSPVTQDHGDKVIVSRIVKRNNCNCDLCNRVRQCLDNYKQHETSDQLAQMFKDAIDNACDIHNISI